MLRSGRRLRKIAKSLLEQPRERLAAVALTGVMWANIDRVQMCAAHSQLCLQCVVYSIQLGLRVQAQCNTSLVGYDNHLASGAIERCYCVLDAGKQGEVFHSRYVFSRGRASDSARHPDLGKRIQYC